MEQLLSSNMVRLALTACIGGLAYVLVRRWPFVLAVVGHGAALMLALSFTLDLGEVYSYADWLKRAFWHFGDDVTTWLGMVFVWAALRRDLPLAVAVSCGMMFSGTKAGIALALIAFAVVYMILHERRRELRSLFLISGMSALMAYGFLLVASPIAVSVANGLVSTVSGVGATRDGGLIERATGCFPDEPGCSAGLGGAEEGPFLPTLMGGGNCRNNDCLTTQIVRPLRHRLISSVGGLWMTLQGGFPGEQFPNTPEKFADLMLTANPFGVNTAFNVDRSEWLRIGTVQTPYLQFGAGYGPGPLALLLVGILLVCGTGVRNIVHGERNEGLAFTVFFIVNALFNHTQPWLNQGPILLVMGFCATHIVFSFWQTRPNRSLSGSHISVTRRG